MHPGPYKTTSTFDFENGARRQIGSKKYDTERLQPAGSSCRMTLDDEDVAELGEGVWPIKPGLYVIDVPVYDI